MSCIPIVRRFFADAFEPLQLFSNLKQEASFLLESKDDESPWSRYSFIGLSPFLTIESETGESFVVRDGANTVVVSSLKEAIVYVEQTLQVQPVEIDVPFVGGAVGFLSYDFISTIEKVPFHPHRDVPMKVAHFVVCQTLLAFDHMKREVVLVHYVRYEEEDDEQTKKEKYAQALQTIAAFIKKSNE